MGRLVTPSVTLRRVAMLDVALWSVYLAALIPSKISWVLEQILSAKLQQIFQCRGGNLGQEVTDFQISVECQLLKFCLLQTYCVGSISFVTSMPIHTFASGHFETRFKGR